MLNGIYALLLLISCVLAAGLNVVALPGNWFIVGLVAIYSLLVRGAGHWDIGWSGVLVIALLALLGELIESLAGMWGTQRAGGSRRAALGAFAGSIGGSLVGFVVGSPIPLVGSLVAATLFGAVGAMIGAIIGEWGRVRTFPGARIGLGAFLGRLGGTLGKLAVAGVMCAVTMILLFW